MPASYVFVQKQAKHSWVKRLLFATLLVFPFIVFFLWMLYEKLLKPEMLIRILADSSFSPAFVLVLIALIVFDDVAKIFYRSGSLYIDDAGVRFKLPPKSRWAILGVFEKDIPWTELKDATYAEHFQLIQLRPKSGTGLLNIRFEDWQLQNTSDNLNSGNASPDLLTVFRELKVFEKYPTNSQLVEAGFDLTKHPATKKLLFGIAILIAYSFVDTMLQQEEYAFFNLRYFLPHIVFGVTFAVVLAGLMFKASKRKFMPRSNIIGLAILSGLVFGVASYVGGIRINQLVGGPLLEARYHRDASCLNLLPEDKNLPVVEYPYCARNY
ncbi:hypothetical protein [Undibacterium sp.]|uniref:hypothetical protein n=1 Tax=Undibacterium sp. TaxID=1914977 RepID=UPI002731396C|nr:hypothetical protein [Undibacterium sp.]MDP1977405.1 hypothetical protein [Undibacterium sp.]